MSASFPSFEILFEAPDLPRFEVPELLEGIYGHFGLPAAVVYANFVSSLDGVVAIPNIPKSSSVISGGASADRFVVAMLRAAADAVVVGAGTFRAHNGPWTSRNAFPALAEDFLELRRRHGLAPEPVLVVVSGSGQLGGPPSKLKGAIVATTMEGADIARGYCEDGTEVLPISETRPIDMATVISTLKRRGYGGILTEGGPRLMGTLLEENAVDELFLTISPILAGGGGDDARQTLADGVELLPALSMPAELRSVRRAGSYLFLRYALGPDVVRSS